MPAYGFGVLVGVAVRVGEKMGGMTATVAVALGDTGVAVGGGLLGVAGGTLVAVGEGATVGTAVAVGTMVVAVGVAPIGVGLGLAMGVRVKVGARVAVGAGVKVGKGVGVAVTAGVGVRVGATNWVGVGSRGSVVGNTPMVSLGLTIPLVADGRASAVAVAVRPNGWVGVTSLNRGTNRMLANPKQ